MAEVIIVGQVAVYGQDGTAMHFAYLRDYQGLPETPGSILAREAGKEVQDWDTPPKC